MGMNATLKKMAGFIAVAAALAIVLTVYFVQTKSESVMQAMGCPDIVKGCSGDGLAVRLDQVPKAMRPFRLEVSAPEAESVEASFKMAGMEMGFNRYRLIRQGDQVWDADVTLPACVRNRKDWLLLLDIIERGNHRQVAIAFTAE
jgi:hypothetical protein